MSFAELGSLILDAGRIDFRERVNCMEHFDKGAFVQLATLWFCEMMLVARFCYELYE